MRRAPAAAAPAPSPAAAPPAAYPPPLPPASAAYPPQQYAPVQPYYAAQQAPPPLALAPLAPPPPPPAGVRWTQVLLGLGLVAGGAYLAAHHVAPRVAALWRRVVRPEASEAEAAAQRALLEQAATAGGELRALRGELAESMSGLKEAVTLLQRHQEGSGASGARARSHTSTLPPLPPLLLSAGCRCAATAAPPPRARPLLCAPCSLRPLF